MNQTTELSMSDEVLTRRADEFLTILTDHAMDSNGIVRTMLNARDLRPLRDEDISPTANLGVRECSLAEFVCYEDAAMTTGSLLAAVSMKYQRGGFSKDREIARRAFRALKKIYDLGATKKPGFFPKPYGGRSSCHYSRDQYLFCLAGFRAYREIADASEIAEMSEMALEMCRYWIEKDYHADYFGLPPSSHLDDHMGSLFLGMMHLGWQLSGQSLLLQEYERLCQSHALDRRMAQTLRDQFRNGILYDGAMYFRQSENALMMKTIAVDALWDSENARRSSWVNALEKFWNEDLFVALDPSSGLNYYIVGYDRELDTTYLTEPKVIAELKNPLEFSELTWGGLRQRSGSAQTAYASSVIAMRLGWEKAEVTARQILGALSRDKFRGITVPSNSHIPPGSDWQLEIVHTEYMAMWLWAYYRIGR